jgi:hypothetical protein
MPKGLVFQFRISLKGINPSIWRRIQVPDRYTFWDLHVAIQDAMGWLDYHLHVFRVRNPETGRLDEIGIPQEDSFDGDRVFLPGWEVPLSAYFRAPGNISGYEYDFGDSWKHELLFEGIRDRVRGTKYPICLEGARACPPEDCGGTFGYKGLLEVLFNPSHENYKSMHEWVGANFEPEAFDPAGIRFDNPKKRWKAAFEGD